jgi:hypothetical protein
MSDFDFKQRMPALLEGLSEDVYTMLRHLTHNRRAQLMRAQYYGYKKRYFI